MNRPTRIALAVAAWAVALGGVAFVAAWLWAALDHLRYPFELEWMEGGSVDHVTRVLRGQPLYVRPSIDFVPFIYTPLYYYVSAALALVTGGGMLPLRLVSFAATLATLALTFDLVRRETGRATAALAAVGFYVACYPIYGCWLELARVDSLALALLVGGAWLARFGGGRRAFAWAGLLCGAAYLTKQTVALVAAALVGWTVAARGWRQAATMAAAAAAPVALAALVLGLRSHGWYFYYTVSLPQKHAVWWGGWHIIVDALLAHPWAALATAGVVAHGWRCGRGQQAFSAVLLLSTLLMSTFAMMHSGAAANVLMPGCWGLALGFGLAVDAACRLADAGGRAPRLRALLALAALALASEQLYALRYPLGPVLTSDADRAAGQALVDRLRQLDGDVYLPNHGFYGPLAGKPMHAHSFAIADILRSSDGATAAPLVVELKQALGARRYSAIVDDDRLAHPSLWGIELRNYYYREDLLNGRPGLWTRTGLHNRPAFLYRPGR